MQSDEIIEQIQQLSLEKKLVVMEATLKSIKLEDFNQRLDFAAEEMRNEYLENKELTSFTSLDQEDFYEPK